MAGWQATGTIFVGVGDGAAVLAIEVGVLFRLGVLAVLAELPPYGVGVAVGVIAAGLTPVELLDAADRLGSPGGGSSAAAGDPMEPITTASTMITTITTTPRIKARRIQ